MVVKSFTRKYEHTGGGKHMPKAQLATVKKTKTYTKMQKLKSAPMGAYARLVGTYQGLSTAVLGGLKRGSEYLGRGSQLLSAKRSQKQAQHYLNVQSGLREKGFFGYKKSAKLEAHQNYLKNQKLLDRLYKEQSTTTDKSKILKNQKLINEIEIKQTNMKNKYNSLFNSKNGKIKTKEQLRAEDPIVSATNVRLLEVIRGDVGNSFKKKAAAELALRSARLKVAKRQEELGKSGARFMQLGQDIKQSYKQGKKDAYNFRRKFRENTKNMSALKKYSLGALAGIGYLAYKGAKQPLKNLGTELLNTEAGRKVARFVTKKIASKKTGNLIQSVFSHQNKVEELNGQITKSMEDITTNINSIPDGSIMRKPVEELTANLSKINEARKKINALRHQSKLATTSNERSNLLNKIREEANNIKEGKKNIINARSNLNQVLLNATPTERANANKLISTFDNTSLLIDQRNQSLDLGYDAERQMVKKAENGQKFIQEAKSNNDIKNKINGQLGQISSELNILKDLPPRITSDNFEKINNALEGIKGKMRESKSIGEAKQNWGDSYKYLDALISQYGKENLVPPANNN
jgi:hypothetical protein